MVVDVIIPVYRPEREKLTKLIDWLNKQTVKPSHVFFMQTLVEEKEDEEVLQMLQKAENVEIVPIEKKDFDHGGTRNKGAALSKADYMLFMTQDAVPVDAYLIENLVRAMEEEEAATAYGRQLPDDTVGVIEHYTREFNYPAKSYVKSKRDLETMGIKTYFCSNVCATTCLSNGRPYGLGGLSRRDRQGQSIHPCLFVLSMQCSPRRVSRPTFRCVWSRRREAGLGASRTGCRGN